VNGAPVLKASANVDDGAVIEVAGIDHYVSRAAHKLLAALDGFDVDPTGRLAVDVGASTGGFTQVLLERGARHVLALDVGHDQLDRLVRNDPRVSVVEGFNARDLTADTLRELAGGMPDLLVADLSFISLPTVLPALVGSLGRDADYVVLIKPQFEVGRGGIREGIVRDAALRDEAVMGVLWAAWDLGVGTAGILPSPIAGGAGNREYLAWLNVSRGTNPTEWSGRVSAIA
jgi:23S rRNA (cytidine1920-2'-O)/16S rRNA (cytidine1409-2'-O)-methyltransferase